MGAVGIQTERDLAGYLLALAAEREVTACDAAFAESCLTATDNTPCAGKEETESPCRVATGEARRRIAAPRSDAVADRKATEAAVAANEAAVAEVHALAAGVAQHGGQHPWQDPVASLFRAKAEELQRVTGSRA